MSKEFRKQPLVSIVMNCHNGESYLSESIKSVLSQTYENWELIFWDNLSTDKSKEILKGFSDNRIKYFKSKNFTTLYEARNLAIKETNGEFISFLDVDDWWIPEKLEAQVNQFENNNDAGLVYSKYFLYNEKTKKKILAPNKKLPQGYITEELLENFIVSILTAMFKKKLLQKFNLYFNSKYNIIGDFDFFFRFSKKVKFLCIQKPLAFYRVHGSNFSLKNLNEEIEELEHWMKEQIYSDKKNVHNLNKINNLILYKKIFMNISENQRLLALKKIFKYPNNYLKLKLFILLISPFSLLRRFNLLN